jgi:hypothetical protein
MSGADSNKPTTEPNIKTALNDMTWWMFDNTCIAMGAERQFDYTMIGDLGSDLSPRLGRCYELALGAFTGWEKFKKTPSHISVQVDLPAPVALVHGFWKHPRLPDGIHHAWTVLEDGRVWEPITGLICDPVLFMEFGQCRVDRSYDETEARTMMLRHQHYGPWHE